jgi:hypothetical protein
MKILSAALITLGLASSAAFAQQTHDHSAHDHAAPAAAPAEEQQ